MAKKETVAGYWRQRIGSRDFRRGFTEVLAREIAELGEARVKDVIDPDIVRRVIRERSRLVNPKAIADLVVHAQQILEKQLLARNASIAGMLDRSVVASIDGLLEDSPGAPSSQMEELVASVMEQDFVQGLFTEIIYSSIMSFYQRLNPLLSRLTAGAMEDQIKAFIRFFMPMAVKEATAFALNRDNQTLLLQFTRVILRRFLEEPVSSYIGTLTGAQRKKLERLIRDVIEDDKLGTLVEQIGVAVWDGVYYRLKNRPIAEILNVKTHARWAAESLADVLLPALTRPAVVDLIASEVATAVAALASPATALPRRARKKGSADGSRTRR